MFFVKRCVFFYVILSLAEYTLCLCCRHNGSELLDRKSVLLSHS